MRNFRPNLLLFYLLLPLVFFLLHFSYGLGTLIGLIFFWNKWSDSELKDTNFDIQKFNSKKIIVK